MELIDRVRFDSLVARFPLGVRKLPEHVAEKLGHASALRSRLASRSRFLRSALLISTAIFLGIWANGLSQKESRASWEREHPPSLRVWRASLEPLGFRIEKNPDHLQQALRKIPSRFEGDEATIWISQDLGWIALFQTARAEEPPTVMCLQCDALPASWTPAGQGWQAFDSALTTIEKALPGRESSKHRQTAWPKEWKDTRELRF